MMVTGIMIISALAYHFARLKEEKLYNTAYLQNTAVSIQTVLKSREVSYNKSLEDNAAWDDMVAFTKNPDTTWASVNLGSTRKTLDLDLIEIYGSNSRLIWSSYSQKHTEQVKREYSREQLQRIFLDGPTCHYFVKAGDGIIEIWGSTVVPSVDLERKTKGQGFLLFGKLWDSAVITELERSTNSMIHMHLVEDTNIQNSKHKPDFLSRAISQPLTDVNGKEIARLGFISKSFYKADTRIFLYFTLIPFGIAVLGLIIFYLLILKWITGPVQKITQSLDQNDPENLKHIGDENKEFRNIAKLLFDAFETRKNLEVEVYERKRAEEKITKIAEELAEINSSKDKFFSILAHDLKSPFHYLLGYSDLLRNEYPTLSDDERKKFISIIHANSQRLYNLLENLLAWSRIQTGRMEFEMEVFDLSREVRQVADTIRISAVNKNLNFECQAFDNAMVKADRNMMRSAVHNLLTNAIKYTPEGGSVSVKTKTSDSYIEVSVQDTGIGMTPEDVSKLFRIDVSLSRPGTNKEPGTGLGLILTKEFVEQNNGTLFVESEPDKGSLFRLSLPLHKA